jgi:hypothetical protein
MINNTFYPTPKSLILKLSKNEKPYPIPQIGLFVD